MALPALDKTWIFPNVNKTGFGATAQQSHQKLLLEVKKSLLDGGLSAWSVSGSSNATVGAMDAVDRWTVANDITWQAAGTAHSWIVLKSLAGPEVCFDCTPLDSGAPGPKLTIVYSYTHSFAGGSNLDRPTAVDEVVLLNGDRWIGTDSTSPAFNYVLHNIRSDDGEAERIILHIGGVAVGFLVMDLNPQNPVAGWTVPSVAGYVGAPNPSTSQPTYQRLWDADPLRGREGAVVGSIYMTSEGFKSRGAGQALTSSNDFTLSWPFFSIAFASQTVGMRGRLTGVTPGQRGCWDLWFGSVSINEGDTYPSDGSNQFVQFGHLIFPWDGSVPVTA